MGKGGKGGAIKSDLQMNLPLADLPTPVHHQVRRGAQGRGSDLEEPPELKPMVASFLQGSPGTSDKEGEKMPLEPDVADFSQWVSWRSERCETPDWWEELLAVPVKEDTRRLAREVRVSFTFPQQM